MKYVNHYNTVEFYVGDITEPQTIKIYTDLNVFDNVQVSEGNKWYSYLFPKDKSLCKIESGLYDCDNEEWFDGIVMKVIVKSNISYNYDENNDTYNGIVPWETTEVSFKGSNTSNVTDMDYMFYSCDSLTSLYISNFNTSNVTSMDGMFTYCSCLTSLNVSCFDTSKVTSMDGMFNFCKSLTSLDVSSFNTSNVTSMMGMFGNCSGLTSLDVSSFDTSKVTDMSYMFQNCSDITSLNLNNFNTNNVNSMHRMFDSCEHLTSLDLSNMFSGCEALSEIKMVGCSEATVKKIESVKPSSATIVTE